MPGSAFDRRCDRQSVLKIAKVVADAGVFDCIIVDLSSQGARIRFGAATALPEFVALRMADGTSFDAVRRWTRGEEAGLEFTADTSLSRAAREQAWALHERLLNEGYPPLDELKRSDYFDDAPIRVAAVAVFAALVELQAVLKQRGLPPDHSRASTTASTGPLSGTGPLQSMAAGNTSTAATTPGRPPGA